ncbi:hypothetical protein ABIF07_006386 [Bradyrhizobium elkanii]
MHFEHTAATIDHSELIKPAALFTIDFNACDITGHLSPNPFQDLGERQDLAGLHGTAYRVPAFRIVVTRDGWRCCRRKCHEQKCYPGHGEGVVQAHLFLT